MPRKAYKTITIKEDVAKKFWQAISQEQKRDRLVDNSTFLERLLDLYRKK